jgi:hypothetical protein
MLFSSEFFIHTKNLHKSSRKVNRYQLLNRLNLQDNKTTRVAACEKNIARNRGGISSPVEVGEVFLVFVVVVVVVVVVASWP